MSITNYIKYRIALNESTQELVDIDNATSDMKKDLICLECKEEFIAVLNHQTPHFKHKPDANCSGSPETSIHSVVKKLFKSIKEIELPELLKSNLNQNQLEKLENSINNLIVLNKVPETARAIFKNGLKENISESGVFPITKIVTEKRLKTKKGDVQIDVVATINDEDLFIEPYVYSKITPMKKEKLILLNIPTISIDLLSFPLHVGQNYKLSDIKEYLISKSSKKWVFNREKKIENYLLEYENYVSRELTLKSGLFKEHTTKLAEILMIERKIELKQEERSKVYDEIAKLNKEISKHHEQKSTLKRELGIKKRNR
jgi:hypothetical protein